MEDTFQLFNIEFWKPYSIVEDRLTEYLDYLQAIYLQGDRELENFEIHHIVPKSIDQNLERCCFNVLKLTGSEHFVAHQLLLKCFTGVNRSKMYYAYNIMCGKFGTVYVDSPEDYAQFRSEFRELCVVNNTKENNPMWGKTHSAETRLKWSNDRKGKLAGSNNPMYGVHRYGESNPRYGKTHTDETKQLIGSNSKGRIWINNGTTNKFVKPEEVEYYTK